MPPQILKFDTEDEYHHVRFNDPDEFDTIRTPDWAENAASSVSRGAEVRMGQRKDSDDWEVEAVLIPREEEEEDAREKAVEIVEKIRS
jgi:hypothetical protein